jgi:hypothetical protein
MGCSQHEEKINETKKCCKKNLKERIYQKVLDINGRIVINQKIS